MLAAIRNLWSAHLFRALCYSFAAAVALMLATDAEVLIQFLNVVAIAVSAGVMTAYAGVFWAALWAVEPSRGHVLAVGIFLTQSANFMGRMISVLSRSFGYEDVRNTDVVSLFIFLAILGGICHLNAPEVVQGEVPTRQWVRIGFMVAAGVFATVMLLQVRLWLIG